MALGTEPAEVWGHHGRRDGSWQNCAGYCIPRWTESQQAVVTPWQVSIALSECQLLNSRKQGT